MPEAMSRWWPFVLVILASQSFTWTVPGRSLRISRRAAGGKEGGFELIGKLVGAEVYDRIKEDWIVEKLWLLSGYAYSAEIYWHWISNCLDWVAICIRKCRMSCRQPQLCVLLVLDMYFFRRLLDGWCNLFGQFISTSPNPIRYSEARRCWRSFHRAERRDAHCIWS